MDRIGEKLEMLLLKQIAGDYDTSKPKIEGPSFGIKPYDNVINPYEIRITFPPKEGEEEKRGGLEIRLIKKEHTYNHNTDEIVAYANGFPIEFFDMTIKDAISLFPYNKLIKAYKKGEEESN